ncbi:MAG: SpoIIE family protein phosphatase [Bryobacteraceae bacterium]|nr:SpoIIE family protein phosphatase [Bryobacteraceae bacterium]
MPAILICDDQPDVLIALQLLLKAAGFETKTADTPRALLTQLTTRRFDLVLTDMNFSRDTTSGSEGLDLVEHIRRGATPPPVVVMTAWGDIDLAVQAMRRGAADFVTKPWDNARLLGTIERCLEESRGAQSEMEIARGVQQKLLPIAEREFGTLRLRASFEPAREIGGDYYDFLEIDGQRLGVLLADVSGKGVPAALLMANLQALFRAQPPEWLAQPGPLLERVNGLFHASTAPEHYATMFYGVYERDTGELRYASAGHVPATLTRADGATESHGPTGTVVGLFAKVAMEESRLRLGAGDRLSIVSDGVTERDVVEDDRTVVELWN